MQDLPINLYNKQQIKELEQIAIDEFGISSFELMTRAGEQVFAYLRQHYGQAQHIMVFCGSGNNAGDGFIVATLALKAGLTVTACCLSDPKKLQGAALYAYEDFLQANGEITHFDNNQQIFADVIVDALLGTGVARDITGKYTDAIQLINNSKIPVIAVDIPSGLNPDTGDIFGIAVKATATVTFIGLKQGLFTGQAADYCGKLCYSSLAIPEQIFNRVFTAIFRLTGAALPPRNRYSHKGSFGHVLIIGGDHGYSGAIKLAGEAALRTGAGLVSIATRSSHAGLININRPELMCHGVETAAELIPLFAKATVVIVGPGLGQNTWGKELFFSAVTTFKKQIVIDADALNILSQSHAALNVVKRKPYRTILTPHVGEAARLILGKKDQIEGNRFATVWAIQQHYGGVVVLKGPGSLIADDEQLAVSTTGNPGMASGGMGDVLSGVIGGLLAQGLSLAAAAQQGVYLHGLAADMSAKNYGERGMLASDLLPYLRELVN